MRMRNEGSARHRLDEAWRAEAARLHLRYVREVVEAYGLCPWAERARLSGRTEVAVLLPPADVVLDRSADILDGWATEDGPEIGFLLYPRLPLVRTDFDAFLSRLQTAVSARHALGKAPFALAAFHPDAQADLRNGERLVPFLRRSPDPCIQAVRMSVLQRVRSGTPQGTQFVDASSIPELLAQKAQVPLRERIARANLETVRTVGPSEVAARLAAIHGDRASTYAELESREASSSAVR